MTKVVRPYSRVYWEALDDPKFASIWDDDRALAAWLRLLIAADMAWPASGTLYHGVHRPSVAALVSVGLVDMQPSGRYRIHGLDKERVGRSDDARTASNIRWHGRAEGVPSHTDEDYASNASGMRSHPVGNAERMRSHPIRNAEGMPSQDEQRRDEQSRDEHYAGARAREGLTHITAASQEVGEAITGMGILSAGDRQLTEWDRLVEFHGEPKVIEAFRQVAGGRRMSYRQLVWDAVKVLEPFASTSSIEEKRGTAESEADWKRRTEATRAAGADMRKAMGYDDHAA